MSASQALKSQPTSTVPGQLAQQVEHLLGVRQGLQGEALRNDGQLLQVEAGIIVLAHPELDQVPARGRQQPKSLRST